MLILLERPGQISCGGLDNRRPVRLAVSSNIVTNQKSNLSHINFCDDFLIILLQVWDITEIFI